LHGFVTPEHESDGKCGKGQEQVSHVGSFGQHRSNEYDHQSQAYQMEEHSHAMTKVINHTCLL